MAQAEEPADFTLRISNWAFSAADFCVAASAFCRLVEDASELVLARLGDTKRPKLIARKRKSESKCNYVH